jgi:molybdenum cofactor cytidylyltransferase/nicotine blue oxidoreductase
VLIGREHWAGISATATGDEGARGYLATHEPVEIDCTGLADPTDLDVPPQAPGGVVSAP